MRRKKYQEPKPLELTDSEALHILIHYILGDDYYTDGPIHNTQANVFIVDDIKSHCKHCLKRKKHRLASMYGKMMNP